MSISTPCVKCHAFYRADTATEPCQFLAATGLNWSGRSGTLWRGVDHVLNESARRWMLALTALAAFGATVGQEWHGHQPRRVKD